MTPLIIDEEIDAMSLGDDSDAEAMSMEMLEYIRDGNQSLPSINRIEECYKMRDCIKQGQADQKGALLFTRNMGKGLHKVFKSVVNEISQTLDQKFLTSFQNLETLQK